MPGLVRRGIVLAALLAAACTTAACSSAAVPAPSHGAATGTPATTGPAQPATAAVPRFDHIVVAVLENHAYSQLIDRAGAPFLTSLTTRGAVLTQSHAITHPSEPNYLAMFSGSTHGLSDDSCPHSYHGPNLAAALLAAGDSFTGYSEDLPAVGFTGCESGSYVRKHNPWADFPDLPSEVNQPLTAFPTDFSQLPTVAFVVGNLEHDMHNGTVADGDEWLRQHLGGYADWAAAHNSLLIVTTDEDDNDHNNRIATIISGAKVRPGRYGFRTDHYGLLRTLLASYRLTPFAGAAQAEPITAIWNR